MTKWSANKKPKVAAVHSLIRLSPWHRWRAQCEALTAVLLRIKVVWDKMQRRWTSSFLTVDGSQCPKTSATSRSNTKRHVSANLQLAILRCAANIPLIATNASVKADRGRVYFLSKTRQYICCYVRP
jgi:hypothetical protein